MKDCSVFIKKATLLPHGGGWEDSLSSTELFLKLMQKGQNFQTIQFYRTDGLFLGYPSYYIYWSSKDCLYKYYLCNRKCVPLK